ncbi:MAG: type II secretion system major pseudopilin GspG [Planctomycetes bacterium]|jgi:general secretion pathway protein G|nr:type II secretion system major pseudopilin GspG [Phycisphaerae bacterium]NBB95550.1 type II secretion system major pseudopilin GspG [Planctomycetota bacterium]
MHNRKKATCAFTLIEVLLVIGILVVLAGVTVVVYRNIKPSADKKATLVLVSNTEDAVNLFHAALNRYPSEEEGLAILVEAPEDEDEAEAWKDGGGAFLKEVPKDPWGQELKYESIEATDGGAASFRVYSVGPDKEEGTEDDIPEKAEDEAGY